MAAVSTFLHFGAVRIVDRAKWMNVSKRVKGTWTIQCDVWTPDLPAAAAKKTRAPVEGPRRALLGYRLGSTSMQRCEMAKRVDWYYQRKG